MHRAGAERDRWVGELDLEHSVQPAQCTLQLRAFVFLILRCLGELFSRVRSSLLELLGQWKKPAVLGRLPDHTVVVGDDGNITRSENLVTARVIEMVVSIDRVLDRLFSLLFDFGYQFFDGDWSKEGVNNEHSAVTDNESG